MQAIRRRFFRISGRAITSALLLGVTGGLTLVIAQETVEQDAEENEVIEEIVVIAGGRSGDPVDLDALHEEMMRERLMIDVKRLKVLEEQNEWRNPTRTVTEKQSRIQWGYKPQDDLRMGRESELSDVSFITTKPASLFSYDF